jgi:hypothetical protein
LAAALKVLIDARNYTPILDDNSPVLPVESGEDDEDINESE